MAAPKKKKEPPDPFRLALPLQLVNFFGLISSGLGRSEGLLPEFVLDCSRLRRYSNCVKLPWLIRTFRISSLNSSPTFVNSSIVYSGSGGVALGSSSGAVRVDDASNYRLPHVPAPLHVSDQSRVATFGSHLAWPCVAPRGRSLEKVVTLHCVDVPMRCAQVVLCSKDEGRLVVNGIQICLKAIPGVFVPLPLTGLMEVVVDMSPDYLRFSMWYLYLEDVACFVKALSALIGPVGSMIAAYISCSVSDSIPHFSSPFLWEAPRLAIICNWLSCRILDCCSELILGNMMVYSFGCHYSWRHWQLVCWWVYRLCFWIAISYSQFWLINDNLWTFLPESTLWIAYCDYVQNVPIVSVGPVSSKRPGCVALIGTVGSMLAAYVSCFVSTSIPHLLSLFLWEETRLALLCNWLSCRILGCCSDLILGNMVVCSFGCHYSWRHWPLVCWWVYRLCCWIVISYSQFHLINDNMWTFLSESSLWIAYCDQNVPTVFVGPVNSKRPGCVARMSDTSILGIILLGYCLCPPFPLAFGLLFLRWIVIVCLVSSLLFHVFLYLFLYVVYPLTIVWMWWQGSCSPATPSPPLFRRLPPSLCVDQHAYTLRMHLCMLDKPPIGGWTQLCLLKFISSSSVVWVVTFLSWAFFSSSLSLLLVSKYAQRRVSLHTGLCWHLGLLQTAWDEVKGKCPLAYEDLRSETRNSASLQFFWFFCSNSGCLIIGLQLNLDQDESKTALWRSRLCLYLLLLQCIDSQPETCISGCCTPSIISCSFSVIRILEQHLCVLGLCLMALELHPWMPRPAHHGCCSFRHCPLLRSHQSYLIVMQVVRYALKCLTIVCIETLFASPWVKDYFTNCLQ